MSRNEFSWVPLEKFDGKNKLTLFLSFVVCDPVWCQSSTYTRESERNKEDFIEDYPVPGK